MYFATQNWDLALFESINHGRNGLFNVLMPMLSRSRPCSGLRPLLALFWTWRRQGGKRALCCALVLVASTACADMSTNAMKHCGGPRPAAQRRTIDLVSRRRPVGIAGRIFSSKANSRADPTPPDTRPIPWLLPLPPPDAGPD